MRESTMLTRAEANALADRIQHECPRVTIIDIVACPSVYRENVDFYVLKCSHPYDSYFTVRAPEHWALIKRDYEEKL